MARSVKHPDAWNVEEGIPRRWAFGSERLGAADHPVTPLRRWRAAAWLLALKRPVATRLRLEVALMRSNGAVIGAAFVFLILAVLAGYRGRVWVDVQRQSIAAAARHERETDQTLQRIFYAGSESGRPVPFDVDPRNPQAVAAWEQASGSRALPWYLDPRDAQALSYLFVRYATLPPQPAAFSTLGVSQFRPYNTRVLPHPRERWRDEGEWVNPLFLALGPFDLAYLIVLVLPLGLILFLHDVLAADRDQGSATLLAVQGGTLRRVVSTRVAIRAVAVMVFVVALVVVAWIAGGAGLSSWTSWRDLGALLTVAVAYAAFWIGLIAAIGLRRLGTTATLMMLGTVWASACLALPSVVDWIVEQRRPLPTTIERFAVVASAMHDARGREEALVDAYVQQHPDTARVLKDEGTLLITPTNLLVAKEVERLIGAFLREIGATEERQRQLLHRLAPLAPPLLAYVTLARVAGTDSGRNDRFDAALQRYHTSLQKLFEPHLMRRNRLSVPLEIPVFTFPEDHPGEVVAASVPTSLFLFAVGALLTGWALYNVRI